MQVHLHCRRTSQRTLSRALQEPPQALTSCIARPGPARGRGTPRVMRRAIWETPTAFFAAPRGITALERIRARRAPAVDRRLGFVVRSRCGGACRTDTSAYGVHNRAARKSDETTKDRRGHPNFEDRKPRGGRVDPEAHHKPHDASHQARRNRANRRPSRNQRSGAERQPSHHPDGTSTLAGLGNSPGHTRQIRSALAGRRAARVDLRTEQRHLAGVMRRSSEATECARRPRRAYLTDRRCTSEGQPTASTLVARALLDDLDPSGSRIASFASRSASLDDVFRARTRDTNITRRRMSMSDLWLPLTVHARRPQSSPVGRTMARDQDRCR